MIPCVIPPFSSQEKVGALLQSFLDPVAGKDGALLQSFLSLQVGALLQSLTQGRVRALFQSVLDPIVSFPPPCKWDTTSCPSLTRSLKKEPSQASPLTLPKPPILF